MNVQVVAIKRILKLQLVLKNLGKLGANLPKKLRDCVSNVGMNSNEKVGAETRFPLKIFRILCERIPLQSGLV